MERVASGTGEGGFQRKAPARGGVGVLVVAAAGLFLATMVLIASVAVGLAEASPLMGGAAGALAARPPVDAARLALAVALWGVLFALAGVGLRTLAAVARRR